MNTAPLEAEQAQAQGDALEVLGVNPWAALGRLVEGQRDHGVQRTELLLLGALLRGATHVDHDTDEVMVERGVWSNRAGQGRAAGSGPMPPGLSRHGNGTGVASGWCSGAAAGRGEAAGREGIGTGAGEAGPARATYGVTFAGGEAGGFGVATRLQRGAGRLKLEGEAQVQADALELEGQQVQADALELEGQQVQAGGRA